jgi:hypothetical protein
MIRRARGSRTTILLSIGTVCLFPAFRAAAQTAPAAQHENAGGGFRIAGTVVSKTDNHPIAGARVILAKTKARQQPQSTIVSDDGRFEFASLPAGKYSLSGAKRGYGSAGYDQHDQYSTAIVTGAGVDTENLVLKLAPTAVISGKVLDEAGEPVRNASVSLYRDNHMEGVHEIQMFRGARTDDLGNYEIDTLTPGTYFLSATAQPWYAVHPQYEPNRPAAVDPSLDVAYPVTYYSDVTDAESATPISIRGSERLQLDIHFNPLPSQHLIVHVPTSGPTNAAYPRLERQAFGNAVFGPNGSETRPISPGTWDITGFPSGRYNLRIDGQGSGSQINGIDLTGGSQELDASTAEPLCTVKVSIANSDATSRLTVVGLRSKDRSVSAVSRPGSKEPGDIANIPAGRYEVSLWVQGGAYSIAHISAEGAEVAGHTLILTPGASVSLSLIISTGSAEVEGTVKRAGKVFAGAMVVLVPKNPEENRDLFRRDQSDLDGTFALHGVLAGSYRVVAIEDGWDLDWSQTDVIANYAKHAVPLQVGDKSGQQISLPSAVEVQSK